MTSLHAQVLVVRRVRRRWPTWRAVWQLDVHERDVLSRIRIPRICIRIPRDWERGDRSGECEQRMLGWDRAAYTACWMPDDRHPSLSDRGLHGHVVAMECQRMDSRVRHPPSRKPTLAELCACWARCDRSQRHLVEQVRRAFWHVSLSMRCAWVAKPLSYCLCSRACSPAARSDALMSSVELRAPC